MRNTNDHSTYVPVDTASNFYSPEIVLLDATHLEPLPEVASLTDKVPRLSTWSPVTSAESLFQMLGLDALCTMDEGRRVLRQNPHDTWIALMQTQPFQRLCQPLLQHMNWYSAAHASPRISQALLGRAIIEQFCTHSASTGYLEQLFDTTDISQYNHVSLLEEVSERLAKRNAGASAPTLQMLTYLLLRETAPELLVQEVADHFCYGRSLQSVVLAHSARFLQTVAPEALPRLKYEDLLAMGQSLAQSNDPAVQKAWNTAAIIPALRYAVAHRAVVVDQGIAKASPALIGQALEYLKTQQDLHAQTLNSLLAIKPPDRKKLAHTVLRAAAVPSWLWPERVKVGHWPVLQEHGLSLAGSYEWDHWITGLAGKRQASVEELVMMGEVCKAGESTVPQRYEQAFAAFKESLIATKAKVIERLLAEMSDADQALLAEHTCEVSRVVFGQEQGLHGVFIRCQPGDRRLDYCNHAPSSEIFFEIIPAAGVARRIGNRFEYRVEDSESTGVISVLQCLHHHQQHQQHVAQAAVTPLVDLDSDAYLHGTVSRSSKTPSHPLKGQLRPATDLVFVEDGNVQSLRQSLARAAAKHLLAPTFEQLQIQTLHQTEWEQLWAYERQVADQVARLLVPFYGCIADLRKGDHSAGVIFNCALDAVVTLVPMGEFLRSTAILALRAGELSVLSMARLAGTALARLSVEIGRQTTALALADLLKPGVRLTRSFWESLFVVVPALRQAITRPELLIDSAVLSKGLYHVPDVVDLSGKGVRARVDGLADISVCNLGTGEATDYRALDPYTGQVYGKGLTLISETSGIELSSAERIVPGHYPPVIPARLMEEGGLEMWIDQGCHTRVLEERGGVFDILVDDRVYRLDSGAEHVALRRLDVAPWSMSESGLDEAEVLCRPKRDLEETPCASGIKLVSKVPQLLDTSRDHLGTNISWAFEGREHRLFRLVAWENPAQAIDVMINDGKVCKWVPPVRRVPGTLAALTEEERETFLVPDTVVYRDTFGGRLSTQLRLGFRPDFQFDEAVVNHDVPVIELFSIAKGFGDARTLRGIRLNLTSHEVIVVEPDTGVFYWAMEPQTSDEAGLSFNRLKLQSETDRKLIDEYLTVRDQYRVVHNEPQAIQYRENLARLLFDMLGPEERVVMPFLQLYRLDTYEQYVLWCKFEHKENKLLSDASRILTGNMDQKKFVAMTKALIGDFKPLIERSEEEQRAIVDVLNNLLPVQNPKKPWVELDLHNIAAQETKDLIRGQTGGSNVAFVSITTQSGDRAVYYALAAGKKAKRLKLQVESDAPETLIDGVAYRDARAITRDRGPDPDFVSLPVTRSAESLVVDDFPRHLDAERLLATVVRADMEGIALRSINVFTFLDTCPSCGGFVLPRLKLDFPGVPFSVTYLSEYVPRRA